MTEWLDTLGYGAESHTYESGFGSRRMGNSLSTQQPSGTFSDQGMERQRKDRNGLKLSNAVPKILWATGPHCHYGR